MRLAAARDTQTGAIHPLVRQPRTALSLDQSVLRSRPRQLLILKWVTGGVGEGLCGANYTY